MTSSAANVTLQISALQHQLDALMQQLTALKGTRNVAEASAMKHFVPASSTNCYGVQPCLHSTAASRIDAGCAEAVWAGTLGKGHWVRENASDGSSYLRPLPPSTKRMPPWSFHPFIGKQCDLTNVWKLSELNTERVRDAEEAHWHQRLRGIKDAMWLSIGSSIDHQALKETCSAFGMDRSVLDASAEQSRLPSYLQHEQGNPWPSVLLISWCWIASLNLTIAHVSSQGIATTALQRNESLQPIRFGEIGAQLARLGVHGGTPTFLSFGGIEWDFKHWRCLFPRNDDDWREPVRMLQMQAAAARAAWPSLRAIFVRTMFKPTSGIFDCECCAHERDFEHYNDLLRQNARGAQQPARSSTFAPHSESQQGNGVWLQPAESSSSTSPCERIHTLDLQRMMLCNETVGTCSSQTGWTVDGLHPSKPVLLGFISLALQIIADWGALCRG